MQDYSTWSLDGMRVRIISQLKMHNLLGRPDSTESLIGICRGMGVMGKILFVPGRPDFIVNLTGEGREVKSYDAGSLDRALAIAILEYMDGL